MGNYGPTLPISEEIHKTKYRLPGETFEQACYRIAGALSDGSEHYHRFKDILLDMRFLPAGRIQCAAGSPREVTAFNCFVSGTIEDDMASIMGRASEAAETMRRGGGVGYNFSRIRPRGDLIGTLDSRASGPVSFMGIYDAVCHTIASAGHRRGAQMGVLNISHPDIEEFIRAKHDNHSLRGFNISVGVTDRFMECLGAGERFPLEFDGKVYRYINPRALWDEIMRSNWDWAEPGVLFLDTINRMNNLWYCEQIEATNPCGEQPLPPNGACLLGSFNLTRYVVPDLHADTSYGSWFVFDYDRLAADMWEVVRAMDNVIDRTIYPLKDQEVEARSKRRMGLGVTGLANTMEILGYPYGSTQGMVFMESVLRTIRDEAYQASVSLAMEKGPFPLFDHDKYPNGAFIATLPDNIRGAIEAFGIRNSHLLSIAPTGTISLTADNVSSGIEPPYLLEYTRTIQTFDGPRVETVRDYAYAKHNVRGLTAQDIAVRDHLNVQATATYFVDSAVSKTCNVGSGVSFEGFSRLYEDAWSLGCKGLTTFRADGKRFGILNEIKEDPEEPKAEACTFDPVTGTRTCDQ